MDNHLRASQSACEKYYSLVGYILIEFIMNVTSDMFLWLVFSGKGFRNNGMKLGIIFKKTKIVANFLAFLGTLLYTNYITCAC